MLECEIPCVHKINQETQLSIELPQLDERNFINCQNFKPVRSPLTGILKFTNKDKELIDEGEDRACEEPRDFIRYYVKHIEYYDNGEIFCLDFLRHMANPDRACKIIKDMISKINSKNKKMNLVLLQTIHYSRR